MRYRVVTMGRRFLIQAFTISLALSAVGPYPGSAQAAEGRRKTKFRDIPQTQSSQSAPEASAAAGVLKKRRPTRFRGLVKDPSSTRATPVPLPVATTPAPAPAPAPVRVVAPPPVAAEPAPASRSVAPVIPSIAEAPSVPEVVPASTPEVSGSPAESPVSADAVPPQDTAVVTPAPNEPKFGVVPVDRPLPPAVAEESTLQVLPTPLPEPAAAVREEKPFALIIINDTTASMVNDRGVMSGRLEASMGPILDSQWQGAVLNAGGNEWKFVTAPNQGVVPWTFSSQDFAGEGFLEVLFPKPLRDFWATITNKQVTSTLKMNGQVGGYPLVPLDYVSAESGGLVLSKMVKVFEYVDSSLFDRVINPAQKIAFVVITDQDIADPPDELKASLSRLNDIIAGREIAFFSIHLQPEDPQVGECKERQKREQEMIPQSEMIDHDKPGVGENLAQLSDASASICAADYLDLFTAIHEFVLEPFKNIDAQAHLQ